VRGNKDQDDFSSLKYVNPQELAKLVEEINESRKAQLEEGAEDQNFSFYGFAESRRPEFLFYDSFDDGTLPSKITKSELTSNSAVSDFESVFRVDFEKLLSQPNDAYRTKILDEVNERASDNLNEYWSQKIGDEKSHYKFKIAAYPQNGQPEQSYINFFIDQGDGFPLHISQKSKGFQWFSGFNLKLRAHQATTDNLSKFILLIDEPGQGLHEEAQKDVRRVLEELASSGVQIVFSTHQPQLLGGEDINFARLKLTIKDRHKGTSIKSVAQLSGQSGVKDALSPVRTALGQVSIDVKTLTNGRPVLVVEGITDYYYLKGWQKLLEKQGLFSIIPCVGVSQAPNVYAILFGWGVAAKVLVDDDSSGTKSLNQIKKGFLTSTPQAQVDRIVYQNTGCSGIEDTFSADDFLKFALDHVGTGDSAKKNSELSHGKKEIIARTFLDKSNSVLKLSDFSEETKKKFEKIFKFAESK